MRARVKATGEIVKVEPYHPPQEYYDSGKCYPFEDYFITSDKMVFSNHDLDFNIGGTPKTKEEWIEAQRLILSNLDKTIEALQRNRQRISQGLSVGNEHWVEAAVPFRDIMDLLGNWSNSEYTKNDTENE